MIASFFLLERASFGFQKWSFNINPVRVYITLLQPIKCASEKNCGIALPKYGVYFSFSFVCNPELLDVKPIPDALTLLAG